MPNTPVSQSEKIDWIRLIRSENVGPVSFRRLLERYGSARSALAALPELARRGGRPGPIRLCSEAEAKRELEAAAAAGGRILARGEPGYPDMLTDLEDPPPILTVLGRLDLLGRNAVSVVGARNASISGRHLARSIATELGQAGLVVVSGLARGIDTAAHEGALASGTVAVLAGGVDSVYPRENEALHRAIADQGAILSEMAMGTVAKARDFPRRNRLISGLSLGVVVIEAAAQSGSLITARMALEQGREVFAVPGSPLDPRSRGSNDLLRQGATLTESAEDVTGVLRQLYRPTLEEPQGIDFKQGLAMSAEAEVSEKARSEVEVILSPTPVTVDEILRSCQLSPAALSLVLLELELAGRLERHPGNRVSLINRM
jgi:DNA processing protein